MKIKKIKFKNFSSYGNKFQEINFETDGNLFLVRGKNGSGKSTIANVIKYGFFGKVDKIKLSDLVNRYNKNLLVEIVFENHGKIYEIKRGIQPNILEFYENGNSFEQSGKKNIQEIIDNIIKIPYNVFINSISLSINDFKSFLTITPTDRRNILDKIFGFDVINEMKKIVSQKIKDIKAEIDNLQITITNIIFNNEIISEKLKESLQNNEIILSEYYSKISEYKNLLEEKNNQLKNIKNLYGDKLKNVEELKEKLFKLKNLETKLNEKKELLNLGMCPKCGSYLQSETHNKEKNQINEKLQKIEISKKSLQENIEKINILLKEYSNNIENINIEILNLNKEISNISGQIKHLENNNENKNLAQILEENNILLEISNKNKNNLLTKLEILNNFLEAFEDTNGIKNLGYAKIVPLLNKFVNEFSKELESQYIIKFNTDLSVIIKTNGFEVSAEQLSTGERKKIDFILLLSIIKFLKTKLTNINIMYLDEIFSSIDQENIYLFLTYLKKFAKEMYLNIFIINHGNIFNEKFDYIVDVNKDIFSNLTIIKNTLEIENSK